jgi:hypothetical protein
MDVGRSCPPNNAILEQAVRVVVQYIDQWLARMHGSFYSLALVSVHDHIESEESVVIPCGSPDSQELPDVDCREPRPL